MSIAINFDSLTPSQQEFVQNAYGSSPERQCSGCAVYLGATPAGEHTYFWHYGASEGYVVLPVSDENPYFDYNTGNITADNREFTTEGKEVIPPPFEYLVHIDVRKWNANYAEKLANGGFASVAEENLFLVCCGGGSSLPKRAAEKIGKTSSENIPWAGHVYVSPLELTDDLKAAAVAVTVIWPNGKRVAVL